MFNLKPIIHKTISLITLISVLYSQVWVNIATISALFIYPTYTYAVDANDSVYEVSNPDTASAPQKTTVESERVDDGSNRLNAQCLIYYDILASGECKKYYQKMSKSGPATIEDLQDSATGDMTIFQSCLATTCGKYPTNSVPQEQTYTHIMQTIKECKLDSEKTVSGNDLVVSDWLYNDSYTPIEDGENFETVTEGDKKQPKIIPYKLLQYKCPAYIEEICTKKERVTQSPVMCFKNGVSNSVKNQLINCLENKKQEDCDNFLKNNGGIDGYVFWLYCDKDSDRDGFYESLSPASQTLCNRADAASLRCEKDVYCTLTAKCVDEDDIVATSSEVKKCENVGRNFEEHIINTACGDQTDIYREDPDCIRINSVTDAIQDSNITLSFVSGSGDRIDDYIEYVLYKKKANFEHQPILAALFYPYSLDKTIVKKGLTGIAAIAVGVTVMVLTGVPAGLPVATSIAAGGIAAGIATEIFKDKVDWETDGLKTLEDDLYRITNEYCKDTNNSCELKNKLDVKDWSWTKKTLFTKKKYTRYVGQAVVWTEPFAEISGSSLNFQWLKGNPEWKRHVPTRIDYQMKINMSQNDILMIYNTHVGRRGQEEAYIGTKINAFSDTLTCNESGVIFNTYKDLIKEVPFAPAPEEKSIHDIAMILPHAGIYTLELYDNDTYTGQTISKYFHMNNGSNYPMTMLDLLALGLNNEEFSRKVMNNFKNRVTGIVEDKISSYSTFINEITEKILNVLIHTNQWQFDHNSYKDYVEDLETSIADISLLYNLLEEIKFEELLRDGRLIEESCNETDFSDYPEKITPDSIDRFEVDFSENTTYSTGRNLSLDCQRIKSSFKADVKRRLTNIVRDLENKRIRELMKYVESVYSDFQEVEQKVEGYLNKKSDRYSTKTKKGSYTASFKSKCGDYQDALDNVEAHYDDSKSTSPTGIIDSSFQKDLDTIKNNVRDIIKDHMDDITITYEYYKNTRSGKSKWDKWHSEVTGEYNCSYTVTESTYTCETDGNRSTTEYCCPYGYTKIDDDDCEKTKTKSGTCKTHDSTVAQITTPCTAYCTGYENGYYGSENNRGTCDTSECNESITPDDWDDECEDSYVWFTTNDNAGTSGYKKIVDTSVSKAFKSWGSDTCDDFTVSPTGHPSKVCKTTGHDLAHFYKNNDDESRKPANTKTWTNTPAQTLTWTSTAKKLDTTTDAVEEEINTWMRLNNYRDDDSVSPYIVDNSSFEKGNGDNVRYDLATNPDKNTFKKANEYIRPIIRNKVVELYRDYLTKYYNNLIKYHDIDASPELSQALREEYNNYYQDYFINRGNFVPFNRIVIKDNEIHHTNKNALNFDITLPGGHYVKNPNAFSITVAPHNEIRKYRCYTNWQKCDIPDNCTKRSEKITATVTDHENKNVPIFKNVTYDCKSRVKTTVCKDLKIDKNCVNFGLDKVHIDYDDSDHEGEFYETVGKAFALNEAIKIFGGQQIRCEYGMFTDFSWLANPFFWINVIMSLYAADVGGIQSTLSGISSWFEVSKGTVEAIKYAKAAVEIAGAVMDSGSDSGTPAVPPELSVQSNDCSDYWAKCLVDQGYTPQNLVGSAFDDPSNKFDPDENFNGFEKAKGLCLDITKSYNAPDGTNCLMWVNDFIKGEQAMKEANQDTPATFDASATPLEKSISVAISIVSIYFPVAGLLLKVAMQIFQSFTSCNQCHDIKCATQQKPKEAIKLLKLSNAMSESTKYTGKEYGLGSGFVAYNSCFIKTKGECAAKFLGSCYRRKNEFCCYNSRITRMLAGQIYQQLGYSYQANGCRAIELPDLQRIDFSSCPQNTIPSPSYKCINYAELQDYLLSQINWNVQKTFDTSTVINAAINAAKNID